MKTLQKVSVCIVLCLLTMSGFASNAKNCEREITGNLARFSVINPFNWQVSYFLVLAHIHENIISPTNYQYTTFIDMYADTNPSVPLTLPGSFTMSSVVQTSSSSTTNVSTTIPGGASVSNLATFSSDHHLNFAVDVVSYTFSSYSYNGIPIVLTQTYAPF